MRLTSVVTSFTSTAPIAIALVLTIVGCLPPLDTAHDLEDTARPQESLGCQDEDGDGYGVGMDLSDCSKTVSDCDDGDADIHPGAAEHCDGVDEDCDGVADNDALDGELFFPDEDGDGYGDPDAGVTACTAPEDLVSDGTDCDDGDAGRYPGADEWCDAADNDCDGDEDEDALDADTFYTDSDGDGYGDSTSPVSACSLPEGAVTDATDCDDGDAGSYPGADEWCDAADNDCDGDVDEDALDADTFYTDSDGDGYGDSTSPVSACSLPEGAVTDATDCDDGDAGSYPGADEWCDAADNDCDGDVDEDALDATDWYPDADGDGYGDASAAVAECSQPSGLISDGSDCDDADAEISPSAAELCNGLDDDCDGAVDGTNLVAFTDALGGVSDVSSTFVGGVDGAPLALALTQDGSYAFCPGTYYLSLEVSASDLDLVGVGGASAVLISGGDAERVLETKSGASALAIAELTLTGGSADKGGAIRTEVSGLTLTLTDCVVSANAAGDGAGIYAKNASVVVDGGSIEGNIASTGGGGLYLSSVEAELSGVLISTNEASDGGGVYATGSDLWCDDCAVQDNSASDDAGGLYLISSWVSLLDSTVDDNLAADLAGAAYLSSSRLDCEATGSGSGGISGNQSGTRGGGVYVRSTSESYGAALVSTACDWGSSTHDNGPDDVCLSDDNVSYSGLGAAESFSCDDEECW